VQEKSSRSRLGEAGGLQPAVTFRGILVSDERGGETAGAD
jgi:hypothetical protein